MSKPKKILWIVGIMGAFVMLSRKTEAAKTIPYNAEDASIANAKEMLSIYTGKYSLRMAGKDEVVFGQKGEEDYFSYNMVTGVVTELPTMYANVIGLEFSSIVHTLGVEYVTPIVQKALSKQ